MPSSGGGTGTPVSGSTTISFAPSQQSAVSLARYAEIIEYPECPFFGVAIDFQEDETGQCRVQWTNLQRNSIARYLAEAQEEIENEVGYFLSPRWVVGSLDDEPNGNDRYVDAQPYKLPVLSRWGKIIAPGVMAQATIKSGAAVGYGTEPAAIGTIATTAPTKEIHIYHPGTDVEITPSSITLNTGTVTINVPRCRLVKLSLQGQINLDYDDLSNFESTVDVIRIYNDGSTNAELVWPHTCTAVCATNGCTERTQTACIYVRRPPIGTLDVRPATYSDGSWAAKSLSCCGRPSIVRLNYYCGMQQLTRQAEDTIVRLAHSKMPTEPCGCNITQRLWERDRFMPAVLTRERINCPFGINDGAWIAYKFTQSMKMYRASVI